MECFAIKLNTNVSGIDEYVGYGFTFELTSDGQASFNLQNCRVKLIGATSYPYNETTGQSEPMEFTISNSPNKITFPAEDGVIVLVSTDDLKRIGGVLDSFRYVKNVRFRYCPELDSLMFGTKQNTSPINFVDLYFSKILNPAKITRLSCSMFDKANRYGEGYFNLDDFPLIYDLRLVQVLKKENIVGSINNMPSGTTSVELWSTNITGVIDDMGDRMSIEQLGVYDCPLITGTLEGFVENLFAGGKTSGNVKIVLQQSSATFHGSVPTNDLFAIFDAAGVEIRKTSTSGSIVATYDGITWTYS